MSDLSAFRRSRIYAEGWNAARMPRTGGAPAQAVNPYTTEAERSRWDEGYTNAQRSNRGVKFTPARVATDPPAE